MADEILGCIAAIYLALVGELWGVYCEDVGEYWPCYNEHTVFPVTHAQLNWTVTPVNTAARIKDEVELYCQGDFDSYGWTRTEKYNDTTSETIERLLFFVSINEFSGQCQPGGHHRDYQPRALTFESRYHGYRISHIVDGIDGCPIFKWVAVHLGPL